MVYFPDAFFTKDTVTGTTPANQPSHAATHNDLRDEIIAIETALGLDPAGSSLNVSSRIASVESISASNAAALSGKASTTHASTHATGGSDVITIAQSQVTGLTSALTGKASTTHASTHGAGQSDAITIAPSQISPASAAPGQALAWSGSAWAPTTISSGSGFRNILHNGGFSVWQRGASVSVTAATPTYTADRWFVNSANTATVAASPAGTRKSRFTLSAGSGGSADVVQRISAEDSYHLAGSTSITLSGVFNAPVGTVTVALYKPSGGVDNTWGTYGAARTQIGSTVTLTANSTARQTATFTGTVDVTGLELVITFSNISSAAYLEDVQLEAGSTATAFERRPYSYELERCLFYFERFTNDSAGQANFLLGSTNGTTGKILCSVLQYTNKRRIPTPTYFGTFYGIGNSAGTSGTDITTTGSLTFSSITSKSCLVTATQGAGTAPWTASGGIGGYLNQSATSASWVDISADL
jgi:hypothetical protein